MMYFATVSLATIIIVIYVVYVLLQKKKNKIAITIPGPDPVNAKEGNFPDIAAAGSFFEYLLKLHGEYGPITGLWFGPQYIVSIASPQLFKEHAAVFDRATLFFENFTPLIGEKSIQLANGEAGRRRHTAYTKCYTQQAVTQYYDNMNKLSKQLIGRWTALPRDSHVPVVDTMLQYTVKTMLQGSMGDYFKDDDIVGKVAKAYEFVWGDMDARYRGDVPSIDSERQKSFDAGILLLRQAVKDAVEYRRRNPPSTNEYLVIDAAEETTESLEELMDDMVTVFVAGFHTTGYLLAWSVYYLASHEDVQQRLFEEMDRVLGDNEVDPDNYKDLRYLHQVTDEALRCSVLATFAARIQDVDSTLGGHAIPAGTPVLQALAVVFKDPDVFPDPDKFDPERFSPENTRARRGYSFEPFGFAGKRRCPGYRFSLVESAILLSDILRSFKVNLVPGQDIGYLYGGMTCPNKEIWITLETRRST